MPLHIGKGRTVGTAIEAIIDYVENPEKTDNGNLITNWQCDSRVADREFLLSKQQYIRNTGRVRGADDVFLLNRIKNLFYLDLPFLSIQSFFFR